ncbi:hypothetical protein ACFV16_22375 [Streptomyces massasporeus]|uniref:hypothetical protein n=1 Tax=Streptomyces massasporeus TaxID=67324 RepID=UPI0036B99EEA
MPSDRTPTATEPAPGTDAEDAGSVVVGLDPSGPGALVVHIEVDTAPVQARMDAVTASLRAFRESAERAAPAVQARLEEAGAAFREFGRSWERARHTAFEFGSTAPCILTDPADAMRWSPPADGEEIPPCPA